MKYLLVILLLSSCYNARKAGQQATKAMETYPAQTASLFREKWPCVYDTVTIRHTDTLENIVQVSCDTLKIRDTVTNDGVKLMPGEKVYIPSRTITVRNTLKVSVRDSSEVVGLKKDLSIRDEKIQKLEKKVENKNRLWIIFLIAFLLSALVNVIQFKTK